MEDLKKNQFKNELNQDLWNNDGKLYPEVREKLLEISEQFYKYLHIDTPIKDVLFTGSLANFNWTDYSDIDLHIIIDFDEVNIGTPELTRDFFLSKKNVWNDKRNIFIKGKPVELYAQHINEPHAATGQFSVLLNKWLAYPEPIQKQVDELKVKELVFLFKNLIAEIALIEDTQERFDKAVTLKNNIIKLRRKSIELDGEISIGNLVFKELRNTQESGLNQLFKVISSSYDKKLSLEYQNTSKELIRQIIREEVQLVLS